MADQEYYEDGFIPDDDQTVEYEEEYVDPIEQLREEMRAEMQAGLDLIDQRQQYFQQAMNPPAPTLEEAYEQHFEQQQEVLEHHLGRPLNDVEIAGLNHILGKDASTPMLKAYQQFKDLPPQEKMRLTQADLQEQKEEARMQQAFERGEILPPAQWSDDPELRRQQRAAYAHAKASGWIE
jgi:hypothetical protein